MSRLLHPTLAFLFCLCLLHCLPLASQETPAPGTEYYLFAYFVGSGQDGLHLAWSEDGLTWKTLNDGKSYLKPAVGESLLFRDPSIAQGPDGTFHMVWTAGWTERGFGYADSKDLITWSEQRYLPLMAYERTAENVWAPDIFYDPFREKFFICWASTIPGRFPETEAPENDHNHRIYYTTTKDFERFENVHVLYDGGFNVIDATIVKDTERYLLFVKDETLNPPQKNIKVAESGYAGGPYGAATPTLTGNYWAEGPSVLRVGEYWYLYFDKYTEGKYGALRSADLKHWEDISERVSFPKGTRHGCAIKVSREILEGLLGVQTHSKK